MQPSVELRLMLLGVLAAKGFESAFTPNSKRIPDKWRITMFGAHILHNYIRWKITLYALAEQF